MRTIIIRSLQALVSISAVAFLTGANDPGCAPGGDGGDTGGSTSSGGTAGGSTGTGMGCPAGSVPQWVCGDPGMPGGGTMGSPDQPPPMGSGSANPGQPPPPMGSGSADPPPPPPMGDAGTGCMPPPPPPCDPTTGMCPPAPGCVLQCVPMMGDACPAGFHQETVCSDPPPPPPMDAGAPVPPAPGMGPGAMPGDPSTGSCTTACVPDDACPPGTVQVTVCAGGSAPSDPMDPSTPPPMDGMCWNECQPVDPGCPPGTHPDMTCPPAGMGAPCQITCSPDDPPQMP